MEKKLIAIDLDGTTLNNNSELTQETIDTLHAVKNLGHEVAIVTGRPYRNSKQYYDQLNLGGPIANFNGALCHIPGMPEWDGKYHITLDSEFVLDLVAFNKTLPVDYLMVEGTELVYSDMEELPECPYYPKDQKPIVIGKDTKLQEQPTAVALFSDVDKQPEIKSKILDRYDNDIEIRTWGGSFPCLEVISPGIHKAKALEHLSRYYGIKQENILAFGDEENKSAAEAMQEKILEALETVIDPELGIDIVNLGLIYRVDLNEEGHCQVDMTLTTMGCPLADIITDEIHRALAEIEEVKSIDVKLVWYPAWSPDRMSRYARIALGIR